MRFGNAAAYGFIALCHSVLAICTSCLRQQQGVGAHCIALQFAHGGSVSQILTGLLQPTKQGAVPLDKHLQRRSPHWKQSC